MSLLDLKTTIESLHVMPHEGSIPNQLKGTREGENEMSRAVMGLGENRLLFQLFFLKNNKKTSVEIIEANEIDFTDVKKRIEHGESVFITSNACMGGGQ